jgi:hypothetical protein
MTLPVDNRSRAIAHTSIIFFLIIVLCFVLYLEFYCNVIIYISLFLVAFDILIGFYSLRKQDIKVANLINDTIEIYHRDGLIEVPINEITEIYSALNYYIDIKGRLSFTYTICFNPKYAFGKKLYLKYYFKKDNPNEEPNEIKILREKMNK